MAQKPAGRRWLQSSRSYAAAALLSLLLLAPGCCSNVLDAEPAPAGTVRTSSTTQEARDMNAVATAAGKAAAASADTVSSYQSEPDSSNQVELSSRRLTCSDSNLRKPNVPFDCEALGLRSNPAAYDTPITRHDPFRSAEICCSAKIASPSHPDVYCRLVSSRKRMQPATSEAELAAVAASADDANDVDDATSAQAAFEKQAATLVGTAVILLLEIGSLGLSNVGATDVLLYGNIRGFRVVAITPQTGQDACAFDASCPGRSSISCKWASLQANSKKKLVVSMVAADAGNHTTAFTVRSAGAFDMNPQNNAVKLPYILIAGCCMADASGQPTCKDMSQAECTARNGLAFSPGLPCARRPCKHAVVKKNAAAQGELGTCSFKHRCFESIHAGACHTRENVLFSKEACRIAQAADKPACRGEPSAVPLPLFDGP